MYGIFTYIWDIHPHVFLSNPWFEFVTKSPHFENAVLSTCLERRWTGSSSLKGNCLSEISFTSAQHRNVPVVSGEYTLKSRDASLYFWNLVLNLMIYRAIKLVIIYTYIYYICIYYIYNIHTVYIYTYSIYIYIYIYIQCIHMYILHDAWRATCFTFQFSALQSVASKQRGNVCGPWCCDPCDRCGMDLANVFQMNAAHRHYMYISIYLYCIQICIYIYIYIYYVYISHIPHYAF